MAGCAVRGRRRREADQTAGGSGSVARGVDGFVDDGYGARNVGASDDGWRAAAGKDVCRGAFVSEPGRAGKEAEALAHAGFGPAGQCRGRNSREELVLELVIFLVRHDVRGALLKKIVIRGPTRRVPG